MNTLAPRRRAFTLVEMMVVLAIIALLSALLLSAFSSLRDGNKRGACQTNLNQIYTAMRLYAQDANGKYPLYDGAAPSPSSQGYVGYTYGIGLWSLYVYPKNQSISALRAPSDPTQPAVLSSYLKSVRSFHCPSDEADADSFAESSDGQGNRVLNSKYLSYQVPDPDSAVSPQQNTYSSYRGVDTTGSAPVTVKRQLTDYTNAASTTWRAPDQTVVTWCLFHHRSYKGANSNIVVNPMNTYDTVLFLDGSVQTVPVEQTVAGVDLTGNPTQTYYCRSWGRVPLAEANATPDAILHQFVDEGVCSTSP